MKLVDRVSVFFLASLGVVLVLFSVVLYGLARHYLYERFDQQLASSLQTLVAAIEVEPDDVKWEPSDHTVTLGAETGREDVRWVVVDEAGLIVDRSQNLTHDDQAIADYARKQRTGLEASTLPEQWRVLQHHLKAVDPKPMAERDPLERSELVVTVALSTEDLNAALGRLGWALVLLSPAIWLVAAIGGRWVGRRALAPLENMAQEAKELGPAHPDRRLTVGPAGDELAKLATAFNGLLDQLFDAFQREKRFAGDAAHQLRTPLTVLEGEIDVALRRRRSPEEYARTLEVLKGQVGDLKGIIESLLFIARSSNEPLAVGRQTLPLHAWLGEYLEKWRIHPRWDDFKVSLEDQVVVDTSPVYLSQALDNVLGNAAKYSPSGSPISVELSTRSGEACIAVTDRGIGVSPDEVEAIFRPFYRTATARKLGQTGTGLGLTIAAGMLQAIGGRIECRRNDPGSTFVIHLPLAVSSGSSTSEDRHSSAGSAPAF